MKAVDWIDPHGCLQRSLLPDGAPDAEAPAGVPVGVPITLGSAVQDIACLLQNELRRRGLWTAADVTRLRGRASVEIQAAIQAALRLDVQTIRAQYVEAEREA